MATTFAMEVVGQVVAVVRNNGSPLGNLGAFFRVPGCVVSILFGVAVFR